MFKLENIVYIELKYKKYSIYICIYRVVLPTQMIAKASGEKRGGKTAKPIQY